MHQKWKMISDHLTTGRFSTAILFGHECAWNPDNFEGFVKEYRGDIRL